MHGEGGSALPGSSASPKPNPASKLRFCVCFAQLARVGSARLD